MTLTAKQLRALKVVSDTLVPSVKINSPSATVSNIEFFGRSASDLGVELALADIIEAKLEPDLRDQFYKLLDILDSRGYNLLLSGKPKRFVDMRTLNERTQYLAKWRDSQLALKRKAFQALKRLVCFLSYTITENDGQNPNWQAIGYPGPRERLPLRHPAGLVIKPITIEQDSKLECDVCVVGSGAGGSVAAFELSNAGFNVLVVEAGGYETADTFDQNELSMMNKLFDEYGTAATNDLSFVLLSGRGAGGGSTVNWMTCIRPPPNVLHQWEDEYGISGLTGAEFQNHVNEVWNTLKVNQSESQLNRNNEVLWKGCSSLGYKEGEDYERIWRNAVGCQERCAFCSYGCVYSCKQSTIINYLPLAFKNGAKFLFNTKIESVNVQSGVATGVEGEYISTSGSRFKVSIRAKAVVISCGSVKTPALLLSSGIKGKNIGSNLRLHPTTAVSGHFKDEIRAWDGPPQTVVVTKFLHSDGPSHGFWIEAAPSHPGLFALSAPWRDGVSNKEYMKDWFNYSSASIVLLKEWGSGRVFLNKRGGVEVSYRLDQRDRSNMVAGMKETARILVAAGATGLSSLHSEGVDVISGNGENLTTRELERFCDQIERRGIAANRIMLFSAHLMGSCRMSSDESVGAVNTDCEVHGVKNLFVADGSVFPTSLGVNPMITIMSLARQTAQVVAKRLDSDQTK